MNHDGFNSDPELEELDRRLSNERPLPAPGFRGELGRRLAMMEAGHPGRPARLKAMVIAYGSSGLALLAAAGAGLVGLGPFAA